VAFSFSRIIDQACFSANSVTSFSLAIQKQTGAADSTSGLLEVLTFLASAIASPLVGLEGEYIAIPLGIVVVGATIFSLILNKLKRKHI